MAWPTTAELKQRLDITSDDWDDHMARLLEAAIAWVKAKVGDWNEDTDEPDDALAQSALERAVEQATTSDIPGIAVARKSESLLYGHRRRFGIG